MSYCCSSCSHRKILVFLIPCRHDRKLVYLLQDIGDLSEKSAVARVQAGRFDVYEQNVVTFLPPTRTAPAGKLTVPIVKGVNCDDMYVN